MQLRDAAGVLDSMLRRKVVPYWLRTAPDVRFGGYRLDDRYIPPAAIVSRAVDALRRLRSMRGRRFSKHLVSQSRMLFAFSLAHQRGLDEGRGDCLAAAELGYRFLVGSMLDARYGGFVWKTDRSGRVADARKFLYGQAFAIYGLVEYHRASGSRAPPELASSVYRTVHSQLHDNRHGGWIELADERFETLRAGSTVTPRLVGHAGLKSGNAHLHWMESLTALYDVTRDSHVAASAAESLDLRPQRRVRLADDSHTASPRRSRCVGPLRSPADPRVAVGVRSRAGRFFCDWSGGRARLRDPEGLVGTG